jgi:hypothetical protein
MNITSEQISHALDETLKEYAKASSMSATSSDIEKAQKRHAATFSGLNKQLAQEFVGMVRLAAIAKLAGEPSALQRNPEKADYIPDFIIKDIPWDKAHAALDKHLGKREEDYGFSALKEELEAGPAGDDEDEKIARYKQFRAELSDKINAGGLFIDGKSPLEGVNLDFKEYVSNFWDSREEIFKIQLEKDTEALIGFLRGKLEEPTGRPLTPTPQLAEAVMPSAIGKDRKYADLYKKILNILNKKRSEIDKEINPALELHVETVEGFKGKYKAQNNQPRRHWGYRGPNTSSEKGWEKFVESLKELKRATIEEAKKDIAAASEEITDLTPIITESDDGPGALQEDKLNKIVIDFNELRKQELNESFLAMFGGWVEHILGAMFGNYSLPVNIRGSKREVESFASALGREKRYLDAAKRYGLDHPTTYKSRSSLDTAVKGFEKDTGLKWPFK